MDNANVSPLLPVFFGAWRVYVWETPKEAALREVLRLYPSATVVFFGDSVGDLVAAQRTRVALVGVICERDGFADRNVVKLADFKSISRVRDGMQDALRKNVV